MKPAEVDNRGLHKRVLGPFVGRRGTLLPVPIRVHDLSVGGGLIECFHEERIGRRLALEIELPIEGENPDQSPRLRWGPPIDPFLRAHFALVTLVGD